jgi:Zn-dependent protease with chaperone function
VLLFCFLPFAGLAQNAFTPLAANPAAEQNLLNEIVKRNGEDLARLDGKFKKYLAEIYKERCQLIKDRFSEGEVLSADEATAYLNAVVQVILNANPSLDKNGLRVLFSKSYSANAFSMGEGTIFFNIGLFHRMENEAQVAFALCHELSHHYLDHGNGNIHKYVNTIYSDEFQRQLKSIQKSEYRRNQQLDQLAKELLFRTRRHSRQHEQAADSMALELLRNTGYDLTAAISTLALLDSADRDKYDSLLQLEKRFNFPSYPFKPGWLESDGLSFAKSPEETSGQTDSLKTHPDCKKRIEAIRSKALLHQKPENKRFLVNEAEFNRLKTQFDYEIIEYCFRSRRVSRALYFALQMLNEKPGDAYLHTMVGRCWNEIYDRQKAHELGKVVELPDPVYTKEYNDLLRLIQNLRLTEIAAIAYHCLEPGQSLFGNNKDFVAAWVTSKNHFGK